MVAGAGTAAFWMLKLSAVCRRYCCCMAGMPPFPHLCSTSLVSSCSIILKHVMPSCGRGVLLLGFREKVLPAPKCCWPLSPPVTQDVTEPRRASWHPALDPWTQHQLIWDGGKRSTAAITAADIPAARLMAVAFAGMSSLQYA